MGAEGRVDEGKGWEGEEGKGGSKAQEGRKGREGIVSPSPAPQFQNPKTANGRPA